MGKLKKNTSQRERETRFAPFKGLRWQEKCKTYAPSYLPNNMTIHNRMATKAPVLRPAEDKKACA